LCFWQRCAVRSENKFRKCNSANWRNKITSYICGLSAILSLCGFAIWGSNCLWFADLRTSNFFKPAKTYFSACKFWLMML
jgi:hypothetical protein